jgi:hypothetical protein
MPKQPFKNLYKMLCQIRFHLNSMKFAANHFASLYLTLLHPHQVIPRATRVIALGMKMRVVLAAVGLSLLQLFQRLSFRPDFIMPLLRTNPDLPKKRRIERLNYVHMSTATLKFASILVIALCVGFVALSRVQIVSAQPAASTQPTTRPADPWVFRCSLEGRPRMLVIALHSDLYLAYDTQDGKLTYAWSGDVEFTGTVYDTRHGPQPKTRGKPLLAQPDQQKHVALLPDQTDSRQYQFIGYRLDTLDGKQSVTLLHRIQTSLGPVEIEETPQFISSDDQKVLLYRQLTVKNLPQNVAIEFNLGRFNPDTELSINGQPQANNSQMASTIIHLNQSGPTDIITHLHRRQ